MKLIKLNAIDSTSTFLKAYCQENVCENFTVVTAKTQTNGRGQLGASWNSESGKNLTFSVLIDDLNIEVNNQFAISILVSLAICEVLENLLPQKVHVKWPNDILADRKKICGVLIENVIHKNRISKSYIGIGVNVNQTVFSSEITKATSIKNCTQKDTDLDNLLVAIVNALKVRFSGFSEGNMEELKQKYYQKLYKFGVPTMFRLANGTLFMAMIKKITNDGRLVLEHDDESLVMYELKQLKLNEFY